MMFTIDLHIQYLLLRHNYVVVPGLGSFVMESLPASYDEATGVFAPPSCVLGFNADLRHNDSMLAMSVARRRKISQQQAQLIVAGEVESMLSVLDEEGRLTLAQIGELVKQGDTILFEPATDSVASWRYAGLPTLDFEVAAPESIGVFEVDFKRPRRWVSIAASVAVLLGVGFMASTPVAVDNLQYASVSLPKVSGAHAVEIPAPVKTVHRIGIMRPTDADSQSDFVAHPFAAAEQDYSPKCDHYLVVASCGSRGEALRFIGNHKSDGLQLLETEGRHRVYIAAGNNVGFLEELKEKTALRYPGTWIFSR